MSKTSVSIYIETDDPEVRGRAIALVDELAQLGVETNLSITPIPAEAGES